MYLVTTPHKSYLLPTFEQANRVCLREALECANQNSDFEPDINSKIHGENLEVCVRLSLRVLKSVPIGNPQPLQTITINEYFFTVTKQNG